MDYSLPLFISFSKIFQSYLKKEITLSQLAAGRCIVGCHMDYLLHNQAVAPIEVICDLPEYRHPYGGLHLSQWRMPETRWQLWLELREVIRKLHDSHQVLWKTSLDHSTLRAINLSCSDVLYEGWHQQMPTPKLRAEQVGFEYHQQQLHWRGSGHGRLPSGTTLAMWNSRSQTVKVLIQGLPHECYYDFVLQRPSRMWYYGGKLIDPEFITPTMHQAVQRLEQ
jgi:hypothetical protein